MSLSVQNLNAYAVQTRVSLALLAFELLFERLQIGETQVGHLMHMLGTLVEIETALRAQTLAIRLAERIARRCR